MIPTGSGDSAAAGAVRLEMSSAGPLSTELVARVDAAWRAADEPGATALVIWLSGGAGAGAWPGPVDVTQVNRWERAVRRLERLPVATIAVAEAECRGPAADLLLATDYRIVARDFRLTLATGADTTWPGMALFRLASQVGAARSRAAALLGTPVTAARALDWGLVDETVIGDRDELRRRTERAVRELSRVPGPELAIRRRLVADANTVSFEEAFGAHLAACDRTLRRHAPAHSEPVLTQA